MTRRKDPAETRIPVAAEDLPTFDSVPVKYRHDGWTPARQKAFIGALADTGSVSRAARYVNMSPEGAYYLRRQRGAACDKGQQGQLAHGWIRPASCRGPCRLRAVPRPRRSRP